MVVLLSDELAAGAGRLRGAADHRRSSRSGSAGTCASPTARCAPGSRRSTRSCRRTSAGWRRCSCSGARRGNFPRFDAIDRGHRDANIESIFYYAVFYPAIEVTARAGHRADHLVRRRPGAGRRAHARLARGLHPVLAALLPADQRHLREVQPAAVGHGLVRADLQAARHRAVVSRPASGQRAAWASWPPSRRAVSRRPAPVTRTAEGESDA